MKNYYFWIISLNNSFKIEIQDFSMVEFTIEMDKEQFEELGWVEGEKVDLRELYIFYNPYLNYLSFIFFKKPFDFFK